MKTRCNFSIELDLLDAARRKSKETGIPLSFVLSKALREWTATTTTADKPANEDTHEHD